MHCLKTPMAATLVCVVLTFVYIQQSSAACCHPRKTGSWWKPKLTCSDCTTATPCCGYKPCNLFCCGCECRSGTCWRKRRDVSFTTDSSAYLKFTGLDVNKNGMMEKCEFNKALETMRITDNVTVTHHWTIMDRNNDGVITLAEFDHHKV